MFHADLKSEGVDLVPCKFLLSVWCSYLKSVCSPVRKCSACPLREKTNNMGPVDYSE